jgi:UDP-N-acetylglucosamine 2-epimerase (non-hydrolysing)
MRFLCAAGARPNFMKVKPVLDALEARGQDTILVHTGQHYDPNLSDVFFEDLGLSQPDFHLGVGSGTQAEQTGGVMTALEPLMEKLEPDVVVVVGDVNSTLGCALVGAKSAARLAHVEAGLRSRDWTMPEEINRVVTDRVSDYLFAPSRDAVDNLRAEGFADDRIHLVGNVMVDTLLANVERASKRPIVEELQLARKAFGLVTLHRPSNVDDPAILGGLLEALGRIASQLPVVFPVHPRARERIEAGAPNGVIVTEPLGYLDFIALEAQAAIVLTDSGGVQEETTMLGVPCLTLRESTERPITVTEGTNQVVGRDPQRIVEAALTVLRDGVPQRKPALWDGKAAERIADVLVAGG